MYRPRNVLIPGPVPLFAAKSAVVIASNNQTGFPAASTGCRWPDAAALAATMPVVPSLVRYHHPFEPAKVDIAPDPTFPSTVPPYFAGPVSKLNRIVPSC